jgi:hypothetical protein
MTLPADFIDSLGPMHPREIVEMLAVQRWPRREAAIFELVNEIRPLDLFCYLGARFGEPNGFQNFLRKDDSDNLIHWEWTLRHKAGIVSFQGMNFRSEVHIYSAGAVASDKEHLVAQIKADFAAHGSGMSEVRRALEHWIEFVNPYQRIKMSVDGLLDELAALRLEPDQDALDAFQWDTAHLAEAQERAEERGARYSKGFGLCFGIRAMLPIMAEAYVRIKSLSLNCVGFVTQPDYTSDDCKRSHSLVNERNDLLHGNVAIDRLSFNEVHFWGRVPIFREYRTMWQRSLGVMVEAVGLRTVRDDVAVVNNLISYLESCLDKEHGEPSSSCPADTNLA